MRKRSRTLAAALFVVYGLALVWVILFKMQFSLEMAGTMRSVNLIPLAGAMVINGVVSYTEVVQNMLAFVPFGLFMGMLVGPRPLWRALVPIAATSLAFEVLQFVFAMGASDITDLLANTVGGVLGIGLYALVRHLAKSDERALRFCNTVALIGIVLVLGFVGLILIANR
ncbi:MAG: VanZ family protein [Gordonibacter sp.]|nr:VanZ family protein [Gordonibacter sp.]